MIRTTYARYALAVLSGSSRFYELPDEDSLDVRDYNHVIYGKG